MTDQGCHIMGDAGQIRMRRVQGRPGQAAVNQLGFGP